MLSIGSFGRLDIYMPIDHELVKKDKKKIYPFDYHSVVMRNGRIYIFNDPHSD